MRLNENVQINGEKVLLIPYESKHVEKYHEWMKSEELQKLTGSEPLSLDEEYEMQQSWREDADKLTFLIIDREKYQSDRNEIDALVGDTNLFLHTEDDGEKVAEAEIMIAEVEARGKGLGYEAMMLMFRYSQENLKINKFEAKIGLDNVKSLKMFEKMKFEKVSESEVFREATLERKVTQDYVDWLNSQVKLNCSIYIKDGKK